MGKQPENNVNKSGRQPSLKLVRNSTCYFVNWYCCLCTRIRLLTQLFLLYRGQRQSIGNMLDKIVSDYETIYGSQLDEDALLTRCTNSISYLDKVIKDIGGGMNSGNFLTYVFVLESMCIKYSSRYLRYVLLDVLGVLI